MQPLPLMPPGPDFLTTRPLRGWGGALRSATEPQGPTSPAFCVWLGPWKELAPHFSNGPRRCFWKPGRGGRRRGLGTTVKTAFRALLTQRLPSAQQYSGRMPQRGVPCKLPAGAPRLVNWTQLTGPAARGQRNTVTQAHQGAGRGQEAGLPRGRESKPLLASGWRSPGTWTLFAVSGCGEAQSGLD